MRQAITPSSYSGGLYFRGKVGSCLWEGERETSENRLDLALDSAPRHNEYWRNS
jgi:hypothetical protein